MADRNWIDRTDEIARIQKKSGLGGYNPDLTGKLSEFLYDLQLEGGQHILPIKMAESLSRMLEVDCRQEGWLV